MMERRSGAPSPFAGRRFYMDEKSLAETGIMVYNAVIYKLVAKRRFLKNIT